MIVPGSANPLLLGDDGYVIGNSLRFQAASSQYLTRTNSGGSSSQSQYTYSFWVKRGNLGTNQAIAGAKYTTGYYSNIYFTTADQLQFYSIWGTDVQQVTTNQVFRDPSAWYHIVIAVDITQSTGANAIKIYVNGIQAAVTVNSYSNAFQVTSFFGPYPQYIGDDANLSSWFCDGYVTEFHGVNAQILTPSSFGTTDPASGQWIAKKYAGTYGTYGFYLPFSDGTSTTTLGADKSGVGNNWTLNNFTRAAGVSDCWMTDVPSGNGGGSSTRPNGNYSVGNPISGQTAQTISASNLQIAIGGVSAQWRTAITTMAVGAGKWYGEFTVTTSAGAASCMIGILPPADYSTGNFYVGSLSTNYGYLNDGNKYNNGSATAYGSSYTSGDVIGIAYDGDNNKVWFSKNGVWQASGDPAAGTNAAFTTTSGANFLFVAGAAGVTAATYQVNFGQRAFAYTPPTGFKALCTANLPAATIKQGNKYMDATLYTGNGGTQTITNAAGFAPDLIWLKGRSYISNNRLSDRVRGVNNSLITNLTNAEDTSSTNYVTAFNSNGFSLNSGAGDVNQSGASLVAWQWQAGGAAVTNNAGTISAQVSANPSVGFSIVSYTGNGTNGATIGHGLGVTPSLIIEKGRSTTFQWSVQGCGKLWTPATSNLFLSANNALNAGGAYGAPNSSTFYPSMTNYANQSGVTNIAYVFAEIPGFSKFGSYTGNGSADGTFVYTGFRPKFVMTKRTSGIGSWDIMDTSRNAYNVVNEALVADVTGVFTSNDMDILSNGFKFRTSGSDNVSGTYIFMAFAENPFQNSNAR